MCDIIYEDNQILVVIKPQNLPVQADNSNDQDLLNLLKDYLVKKYNKTGNAFLGLVHRLDRPTGGVMVFAKTSKSANRLCEQIKCDDFEKTYLAVVYGRPKFNTFRLRNYLKKDEKNNIVRVCPQYESGAKEAILDYKVLCYLDDYSLVQVNLITGRSHQIRVQFATIGCPVVGDKKYGKQDDFTNLALWATILKFNHPVSKQRLTYKIYPPEISPWTKFEISKLI